MNSELFDRLAAIEDTHWWFKARRRILLDVLRRYVPANQGKTLAEIGCGTGGNLRFFRSFYRVLGSDVSGEAVSYARGRVGPDILLGDFREVLAGRWPEIDAVLLADVLEHVEDDADFLRDLVQRLKPGAVLLITVPAHQFLWNEHDVALGHKRRYSPAGIGMLASGLPVTKLFSTQFNTVLFPLIALYRLIKGRGTATAGNDDTFLPPSGINRILYALFSLERLLIRLTPLPFGVSGLLVLRKNEALDD